MFKIFLLARELATGVSFWTIKLYEYVHLRFIILLISSISQNVSLLSSTKLNSKNLLMFPFPSSTSKLAKSFVK